MDIRSAFLKPVLDADAEAEQGLCIITFKDESRCWTHKCSDASGTWGSARVNSQGTHGYWLFAQMAAVTETVWPWTFTFLFVFLLIPGGGEASLWGEEQCVQLWKWKAKEGLKGSQYSDCCLKATHSLYLTFFLSPKTWWDETWFLLRRNGLLEMFQLAFRSSQHRNKKVGRLTIFFRRWTSFYTGSAGSQCCLWSSWP